MLNAIWTDHNDAMYIGLQKFIVQEQVPNFMKQLALTVSQKVSLLAQFWDKICQKFLDIIRNL